VYAKFITPSRIMSNGDQVISVGIVGFDAKTTSAKMLQASIVARGADVSNAIELIVSSWETRSDFEGIAVLKTPRIDVAVSTKFSLSVVPAGDQSRKVIFDVEVEPAIPKVARVLPSSFSNSADADIYVTIDAFPVVLPTAAHLLQVQAFGKMLPVVIRASSAGQTLLSFTVRASDAPPVGNATVSIGLIGGVSVSLSIQVLGSIKLVAVAPSVATAGSSLRLLVTAEHSSSSKSASLLLFCVEGCTLSGHRPPTVLSSRTDGSRSSSSIMVNFISTLTLGGSATLTLCDNPSGSLDISSPPRTAPNTQCVDFALPVQRLMPKIAALQPRSGPISGGMPVDLVLFALDAADLSAVISVESQTVRPQIDFNSTIPGTNPAKYTRTVRFILQGLCREWCY
jgi:hypothetical protein